MPFLFVAFLLVLGVIVVSIMLCEAPRITLGAIAVAVVIYLFSQDASNSRRLQMTEKQYAEEVVREFRDSNIHVQRIYCWKNDYKDKDVFSCEGQHAFTVTEEIKK